MTLALIRLHMLAPHMKIQVVEIENCAKYSNLTLDPWMHQVG